MEKIPEKTFETMLKRLGYKVYRNGWPDYLIEDKDGNLSVVEFKSKNDRIRSNQLKILNKLSTVGLNVFVISQKKIMKPLIENDKLTEVVINPIDLDKALADIEKQMIHKAIEVCKHNLKDTARKLNISFDSLRHRLKKYNID